MSPDERRHALARLAEGITGAGLTAPAEFLLDLLRPVDLICCQIALFFRPFAPGTQGRYWIELLGEETSWQELRRLIGAQRGSEQSN